MNFFIIIMVIAHFATAQKAIPLSKADKQAILDTHNALRARVARGDVPGQPSAANMMLMEWDERLAVKAQNWALQCVIEHDTLEQRLIPPYGNIGQNIGLGDTTNNSALIEYFFDEYKYYTYNEKGGSCQPQKMCGHYTAVVWALSVLVGCGVSSCPSYPRLIVCNYAPGGNVNGWAPYASGPPASQCIGECTYTDGKGVCLRKDQCTDSAKCRCAITCMNGGTLNSESCKCSCTPDFYGSRCEVPCVDDPRLREQCETDTDACTNILMFCNKTCKQCIFPDRDRNAENPDGTVGRVPDRK